MSHHGVFYTDSFFDLSFDFDCTLAGQGDFRRILQVAALAFLRAIYVCKIIAYHTTIWITAAASGHACKSVYNPFASKKTKVKKNPSYLLIFIHITSIFYRKRRGNGNHSAAPPSCEPFRFKFSILLVLCKLLLHLLGDDLKEVEVQNKGEFGEIPGSHILLVEYLIQIGATAIHLLCEPYAGMCPFL